VRASKDNKRRCQRAKLAHRYTSTWQRPCTHLATCTQRAPVTYPNNTCH